MKSLNLVFFGTPDFATLSLQALIDAGLKPIAVVTREDKPGKRGKDLIKSPVKLLAEKYDIQVLQPKKLDNVFYNKLYAICPKLCVVVAYGKILPKNILDIPEYGTLNVHGSLLPRLRGASPIQTAILNDEKETGVTIMKMDEGMDTGNIIAISKVKIKIPEITSNNLFGEISKLGADLLVKTIPDYISGKLKPKPQDNKKATYTKIIKKEDGHINWHEKADIIERRIRAYYSWPSAHAHWHMQQETSDKKPHYATATRGKQIKILPPVSYKLQAIRHMPGFVFLDENKTLAIACKNGYIIPSILQLEGKSPMSTRDFLNGNKKIIGTILN